MPPRGFKDIQVREDIYRMFIEACRELNAISHSDCLQKLLLLYYKTRNR